MMICESQNSHIPQNTPRAIWPVVSCRGGPVSNDVDVALFSSGAEGQNRLKATMATPMTATGINRKRSSTYEQSAVPAAVKGLMPEATSRYRLGPVDHLPTRPLTPRDGSQ